MPTIKALRAKLDAAEETRRRVRQALRHKIAGERAGRCKRQENAPHP
jgi:hypothetical protein